MKRKGKRTKGRERRGDKKEKVKGKGKEKEKEMGRKGKVLCSNFLPTKTIHLRGLSKYFIKLKKFPVLCKK